MEGITRNYCMLEMEVNNPREKYRGAIYVTSLCDLSLVTVPYPFFGLAEGYLLFPSPMTASLLVCQQQL
jgi:hypothetical protein